MKKIFLIVVLQSLLFSGLSAQTPKVNWITFEEAIAANKATPKKIFIDLYTDWCGWCKKMDRDTFADSAVASYMNENFYCVKFNAEMKDTVNYKDIDFTYVTDYKAHSLAVSLMDGKMSYPTYVILTEDERRLKVIPGYQEKGVFMQNLKILAEWKDKN